MNVFFGCLVIFFVTISCNDSSSTVLAGSDKSHHKQDSIQAHKKEVPIKEDSSIVNEIPVLAIAFIESLESGWDGPYQQSRLAKRGFKLKSTQLVGTRTIFIFENTELDNQIHLGRITYPDGETEFSVKYNVKKEQFYRFKEGLPNSWYKNKGHEIFVKKGLGTYASKTIATFTTGFSVVYSHVLGKELSEPDFLPLDSIPTIPRLEIKPPQN